MSKVPTIVVNGWSIIAHPLFIHQVEMLIAKVEELKQKDPTGYKQKNETKRLAAITKLAFKDIPDNPTKKEYRQGDTLGDAYKHWFRAKFFQQYRLFFRYDEKAKLIIYAWVNDENTLRAYGSKDDAYKVFAKMLVNGNPPDSWDKLRAAAEEQNLQLHRLCEQITGDDA